MGFEEVTSITHHAEDILNKLRKNELTITQEIIDVLLNVHDWIRILIDKINNRDDSPTDYSETVSVLLRLKDGKNAPPSTAPKPAGESGGSSLEKVLIPVKNWIAIFGHGNLESTAKLTRLYSL